MTTLTVECGCIECSCPWSLPTEEALVSPLCPRCETGDHEPRAGSVEITELGGPTRYLVIDPDVCRYIGAGAGECGAPFDEPDPVHGRYPGQHFPSLADGSIPPRWLDSDAGIHLPGA